MNKITYFIIVIGLVFTGCSLKNETLIPSVSKNKKIFEAEDTLILFALRAQEIGEFRTSADLFEDLYEKSGRLEYIYRSLQQRLYMKENTKVITLIDSIVKPKSQDFTLVRLKIVALIQEGSFDKAFVLARYLSENTQTNKDYILLGDILCLQKKYKKAARYLREKYEITYDEKILDKLALILYGNLHQKDKALTLLNEYVKEHTCSEAICNRLVSIYKNEQDVDGLLATYLKLYTLTKDEKIVDRIIQLYGYKNEYHKLIVFLENTFADDVTLLELYIKSKNYKKASPLAQKLYDKTGDVKYFGESVIYEYESTKDKNDSLFLDKIALKFEKLLQRDTRGLFLNYYGYILIDHELDIDKGIRYIKKALESEPTSFYYLDSLAWGYYKKGECKKSLIAMEEVLKVESKDAEVLKHLKIIKNCKGKK
ncbi:hypothetical protein JHD48_08085 [Sulfurimonas sp. SAG-AH-194-I05]|nr:hypothetical protein [Sulfurimonas sp. SAG-AH-194-I05]MDF1875691.1 hypothetical protein [Sulfurimonas sp. SAG-AH-194-I05]